MTKHETIKIGQQLWMKRNLDVDVFNNGDFIKHAKTEKEWILAGEKGEPAWCYYNNSKRLAKKYGKLYNWYVLNDPRGIAPPGFILPSDVDWNTLKNNVLNEGFVLFSKKGWSDRIAYTDTKGFDALPGGYRSFNGVFFGLGRNAFWWSISEDNEFIAWCYYMRCSCSYLFRYADIKSCGFSIRCIKNE